MKSTLVIGASIKPDRYSNIAINLLREYAYDVIAFGVRAGKVKDVEIQTEWNPNWEIDTVTLYINPTLQEAYYSKILDLKPRRVIFNPGTENPIFSHLLNEYGIETEEACTLVLLRIGNY